MKKLMGVKVIVGLALWASGAASALTAPEDAFSLVQEKLDAFVGQKVDRLIPLSMHAHTTTGIKKFLEQGKYAPGEFSDYLGDIETTVNLQGNYYVVACHVNVNVNTQGFAMNPANVWVLEQSGEPNGDQLVGKFKINTLLRGVMTRSMASPVTAKPFSALQETGTATP